MKSPYKVCPNCQTRWETLDDFLEDPAVQLVGYQVHFESPEEGLFLFTHARPECLTTMALPVKSFASLNREPILSHPHGRPQSCPGLCVRQNETGPCPENCECVWVRDVMQIIRLWKKTPAD